MPKEEWVLYVYNGDVHQKSSAKGGRSIPIGRVWGVVWVNHAYIMEQKAIKEKIIKYVQKKEGLDGKDGKILGGTLEYREVDVI